MFDYLTVPISIFVALLAVWYSSYLEYSNTLKGLKYEIQKNYELCLFYKTTINEVLPKLDTFEQKREIIPSISHTKMHNSVFHQFEIKGYFLKLDISTSEKIEILYDMVEIINQHIDFQHTIVFGIVEQTLSARKTELHEIKYISGNLSINLTYILERIAEYEKYFNSPQIQKFIR